MRRKFIAFVFCLTFSFLHGNAQKEALTIADAEDRGLSIPHLDSVYLSAVHADTSMAVFKSEAEQKQVFESYVKMLKDWGDFLAANEFKWEQVTRGFNRIYFNADGTIDYFLYDFKYLKPEDELSEEKQEEFNRLLNQFIQDYKFSITGKRKFAQCSPTSYMPREE